MNKKGEKIRVRNRGKGMRFVFISEPQIILQKLHISQNVCSCCLLNVIFILWISQPKFG